MHEPFTQNPLAHWPLVSHNWASSSTQILKTRLHRCPIGQEFPLQLIACGSSHFSVTESQTPRSQLRSLLHSPVRHTPMELCSERKHTVLRGHSRSLVHPISVLSPVVFGVSEQPIATAHASTHGKYDIHRIFMPSNLSLPIYASIHVPYDDMLTLFLGFVTLTFD